MIVEQTIGVYPSAQVLYYGFGYIASDLSGTTTPPPSGGGDLMGGSAFSVIRQLGTSGSMDSSMGS